MTIFMVLLTVSWAAELLLTVRPAWRLRVPLAALSIAAMSAGCVGIVNAYPSVWSGLLVLVGLYRIFNLSRAIEGRMQEQYGRHSVREAAAWMILAQCLLFALATTNVITAGQLQVVWALTAVQFVVALSLAWLTIRQLQKTSPSAAHPTKTRLHDHDLPSVTVAVPARNEDDQLEACLDAVLASDYPKLEILVLDDCSSDKTPEIIRQYAQQGVRFVRGQTPSDGWLAKNQAYEQLYKESTGTLVLFCGVDIRFKPSSIRQLVTSLIQRDKTMVSVLPLNPIHTDMHNLSLAQLMRYYWEMAPPRRLFNRPPVLSSCWLITRESLRQAGGFKAVKRSITPEAHFAKIAIQHGDGYAFIRSDRQMSIASHKSSTEQLNTAVQTRYPQLHRRPELVLLIVLVELVLIIAPIAILAFGVATNSLWLIALSTSTLTLHAMTFHTLWQAVFAQRHPLNVLLFLPAVINDLVLLHYSMYKYEFSEVYWKGRNVCYPVMRVYPHLPEF